MKTRIVLIFIGFVVMWSLILVRTAVLQFAPDEKLKAQKLRQYQTSVKLSSLRGAILDRKGKELAVSVTSYSLFADPHLIRNDNEVALKLSEKLGLSYRSMQKLLSKKDRRFVWVKRHLSKAQKQEIDSWRYRGLAFIEESKRVYPNEMLLGQTLGFVGRDGRGLEGLELAYDEVLQGKQKEVVVQRDARGRPLLDETLLFSKLANGSDIELTIDLELQHLLESELLRATEEHEADHAVGIVLDAKTSAILAMATTPGFDPNRALSTNQALRRNRVILDSFEPGSTFKPFAIAAALREEVVAPNSVYYAEKGSLKIGKRTIRESDRSKKWEDLTVTEILARSSNIGVTKVAFDLGSERYRQALLDFGFGEKTGVEFPGEAQGILHGLPWREHLLSNISFGHGIAVTALQLANAYAAIANGGVLNRPFLVQAVHDSATQKKRETKPESIRRVLSEQDAEKMRLMLMAATSEGGTGRNARVPGFPVGGKTGTAQKVDPNGRGYLSGHYISSFAGFIPAHAPEFVIYVAVDSPKKGYYGSQVAAPVFRNVASHAVRQAGLVPILLAESKVSPLPSPELDLLAHTPEIATRLDDVLENLEANPLDQANIVPKLEGLTIREVTRRLRGQNIQLEIRGSGQVARVHPKPGTPLKDKQKITVWFE